jgi:hypothetical protein
MAILFSYVGLVFDIIGATSSLLYSILLGNSLQLIDDYLEDAKHLSSDELGRCFNERTLADFVSRSNARKDLIWETIRSLSEHLATTNIGSRDSTTDPSGLPCLPTLRKSIRRIEILCMAGEGASLLMIFGALFLLASVLCIASATQPPTLWVTILTLCFIFVALHSWMICWAILLGKFDLSLERFNSSDGGFEEFQDEVKEENLMRDIAEIS